MKDDKLNKLLKRLERLERLMLHTLGFQQGQDEKPFHKDIKHLREEIDERLRSED